ncbi:selenium-dependent molybdenum hydroxylase 1 [Lachnoanaerobaculum saburreum F0468]|uniref:Selenium-dependent molybdenum hydroxylase 1 n=1 Tax=Lachnoanaerobaculum saburreum F0468 TaxID=1095750 RepID=I0R5G7_9FIRM|nr:selenium-dependent xanthine dehydrogenase [Lachnoanaerobaculum saburreum]EIC94925.1 selenium-dependent molybdenum hydroxylase 1 [Lachnoanaerobaculum saburreum F0468]
MYSFTVNGKSVETEKEVSLLRFLRDDLKLKSIKDGCSQGACGTCTIIIDGKATRACVMTTKRAQGMNIVSVEGLSEEEKEIFVYAFGSKGAVQCGFCIPGMVMSGKALIDKNPNPTEADIKEAIKGNICRCTGYKKIIEAIDLVAQIKRGDRQIDKELEKGDKFGVGSNAFRIDVREKVLGYGEYVDDVEMEDMLHVSAVRTKYPRARILDIDFSEALKLEGVVAVYTAEDVPNIKVGHIQQDWDVMIAKGEITRFVGDALCLVVAKSEEILKKAKTLVKVEYEVLEPVRNITEAMAEDAPKIHPSGNLCQSRHVRRGDAKTALKNSKYTVTETFDTPFTEHAFLEPECAIAFPYKDGVKIYSTDQSVFDTRKEVSIMFGWDPEKIVVENKLVGGGFGGKEDVTTQHIAALCAYKLKRTVKAKFSRDESLAFHPKRHAMHGTFTLGCDENGIFTGLDCDIYFDTGAYASLCGPVLERACTHAVGPYCYQNHDIRGYGYYTNNPPAGAFRGFGVCQSEFALESIIDLLAEKVGISPWEIRYRNAIEPEKILPNGQIADCSTALKETLEAVKPYYDKYYPNVGIACAMKNAGVGVGLPDTGRARLKINDGKVEIYCGASDIGQGCSTVFIQMVAETLGLSRSKIKNMGSNSELDPDSGTTSGSRQTLISGEAVRRVSVEVKAALDEVGGDLDKLNGREFYAEYFEPTDKLGADVPFPKSHVAYAYATHLVVLDEDGKVSKVVAAHDSGKVVNPISIQGQIEGGVLMSLGYAFTEDFKLQDCMVKSKYGTLGLMRATDIPDIQAIYVEKKELLGVAYGSKGIGEIATIPTAPAAQNAYYKRDGKLRPKLPMDDTYYTNKKKK